MVEVFGRVESNEITEDGDQRTVFRIPAVSESLAKRRARGQARLKELSNFSVESVEVVGRGSLPAQQIYDITVISER